MQKTVSLKLLPSEAASYETVIAYISKALAIGKKNITGFYFVKRSIDARSKQVYINLSVLVFIDEPFIQRSVVPLSLKQVHQAKKSVIVVGAGPAGLFAALKLIEHGIKPIIIERGKDVRDRRRDLAALNKEGIINPESNYCFGEGGAGTYSDGKLYTRSTRRGSISRILSIFVQFGAAENILYESHPHIGTNKLPGIISAMREKIIDCGGEFLFNTKLTDLIIKDDIVTAITTANQQTLSADAYILATGHSARDIFIMLHQKKISIEAKPFALGVRIEHPQLLIDTLQYHCAVRGEYLPPASYSLVQQVNNTGVFSFCMCPGGIIAPAATSPGELVVNGWSPSKRNNPYSNSGIVVQVNIEDALKILPRQKKSLQDDPLVLMKFQQYAEQKAFNAGGGKFVAPAQRMVDFCNNTVSTTLPDCSYLPGVHSTDITQALPKNIYAPLQKAFTLFGKKMKGYYTNEAIIVATESRTSSPVRIPRNAETLHHPQVKNLYPCGEGAGYAGGIVSAAMDGENVAEKIIQQVV